MLIVYEISKFVLFMKKQIDIEQPLISIFE